MKKRKEKEKLKVTILKDSKKDFSRKSKKNKWSVYYPKFNAKVEFFGVELEFSDYDSHKRIGMDFKELCKIPKNRHEYGQDFMTSDGRLMIMRFKLDNRGKQVITRLEVI